MEETVYSKEQLWQSRLDACQKSGISAKQWCAQNHIAYSTYFLAKKSKAISVNIPMFKGKALRRGRLTPEETKVEDSILLDNLHLIDEDGYLIRAAMLAFYKDPEKWVTGSYIKIGYFGDSDSDLRYQDEVHGSLIEQVDKTVDLVYTKYMKALIYYEGIQRIEQFMFHQDAFREILLNAVVHKDYSSCNPIQISVYEDKIYIWNDGEMPEDLNSTDKLFMKHSSKPYNPKLANVFFMSGMIEAWGRGFDKIKEACARYDGPLPEYDIKKTGIMVLCKACDRYLDLLHDKSHPVQSEQDDEQDVKVIFRRNKIHYTCVANSERKKTDMTEYQWKELSKWCLDNGQRKLTKEEKEVIKLAIDQTDSLNELAQVAFASLAIDSNR